MIVCGINNVREALEASAASVEAVIVTRDRHNPRLQTIIDLCRHKSVPLRFQEARSLDRLAGDAQHQHIVARISALPSISLSQALEKRPQLLMLADSVEDPRNLGALIRTADATGVGAVLLPDRRSCALTEAVVQASAGAAFHVPVVRIGNSGQALDRLRAEGYWMAGLDMSGSAGLDQIDTSLPLVVCVGGEHQGLRGVIRKRCDFLVSLPMAGKVSSLNLSVAAAVLLYHILLGREQTSSTKHEIQSTK